MNDKISNITNAKTLVVCLIAAATIPFTFMAMGSYSLNADSHMSVGSGHSVYSYAMSIVVGMNNVVSSGGSSAVIGYGLFNMQSNSAIVGQWNQDKSGLLFSVGNGTGSGDRKNAFEVYSDGRVIVTAPQSDIPMY